MRSLKELPREGLPVLAKRTKNKRVQKAAVQVALERDFEWNLFFPFQDLKIQMIWRGNLA